MNKIEKKKIILNSENIEHYESSSLALRQLWGDKLTNYYISDNSGNPKIYLTESELPSKKFIKEKLPGGVFAAIFPVIAAGTLLNGIDTTFALNSPIFLTALGVTAFDAALSVYKNKNIKELLSGVNSFPLSKNFVNIVFHTGAYLVTLPLKLSRKKYYDNFEIVIPQKAQSIESKLLYSSKEPQK